MPVKFIAIAGDSLTGYYYDTTHSTIISNHYETILNMHPITHADLQTLLNNL